jgi:hypothetical protein
MGAGRATDDDAVSIFLTRFRRGAEVVTKKRKKTEEERKEKREEKRWQSSRRIPDALSGFVCDLHSQTPDPSVFLFEVSHIDAVALVQSCLIGLLPFGSFAGSLEACAVRGRCP